MNGVLIINKETGLTSRDVINRLEKKFNTKKIGHTGTLDPNASGVLVVCIGKALKISELLSCDYKEYIAEVILGLETDTLDTDVNSTIIKNEDVSINKETIINTALSFKRKYMQEVPMYSAVKVKGRKLYEYARSNIPVEVPKKEVEIKHIEVLDGFIYSDGKIYFKIKCLVSKGTYIRSLVRDIGKKLGTCAVLNSLVRTKVGNFNIEDGYTLDDINGDNYKVLSITDALPDIPIVKVNKDMAFKISNGVPLDSFFDSEMAFIMDSNNNLLALYKNDNLKCRTYKMFV